MWKNVSKKMWEMDGYHYYIFIILLNLNKVKVLLKVL